jgi:hypothetical protein
MIILSVQWLNEDPIFDINNTSQTKPISTSTPEPSKIHPVGDEHDIYDDFGISDNGVEDNAAPPHSTIDETSESEKRHRRAEELGVIEQANVATFKNGIIGIYPATGSELGGTKLTFMFAFQNESVAGIWPSAGYFGGCIIDGTWVPLSDSAYFPPSQVFLLTCTVPAHNPGEVESLFLLIMSRATQTMEQYDLCILVQIHTSLLLQN